MIKYLTLVFCPNCNFQYSLGMLDDTCIQRDCNFTKLKNRVVELKKEKE